MNLLNHCAATCAKAYQLRTRNADGFPIQITQRLMREKSKATIGDCQWLASKRLDLFPSRLIAIPTAITTAQPTTLYQRKLIFE